MTCQRVYTLAKLLLFLHLILDSCFFIALFLYFLDVFFLPLNFLQNFQPSLTWNSSRKHFWQGYQGVLKFLLVERFLGVWNAIFLFLKTKCSSARTKFHLLHPTTTSRHKPFRVGGKTAFPSTELSSCPSAVRNFCCLWTNSSKDTSETVTGEPLGT